MESGNCETLERAFIKVIGNRLKKLEEKHEAQKTEFARTVFPHRKDSRRAYYRMTSGYKSAKNGEHKYQSINLQDALCLSKAVGLELEVLITLAKAELIKDE